MAANNVNICKSIVKKTEETFIWEIDNFSDRRQLTGEYLDSGYFTSTSPSGITLKLQLRIYPNGDSQTNKDYISIYVINSSKLQAKIECSIRDAKGVDKHQTVCESRDFYKNQVANFATFTKRDELLNEENELLPGDRLTVVCKSTLFEETMVMESFKIDDIKVPECNGMEDIGTLLENGIKFTDCKLVATDGKEFKVYKGILACRSRVFAAMFEHEEMSESKEGIVKIKDIKSEVLEQMLRFIYDGTAPKLDEMAKELLEAADKYELDQLKAICELELANSMNTENVCELLDFAYLHSAEQLKTVALKFIQQHANEVMKSDGWKMFKANCGELIGQIVETIVKEK